MQFLVQVPHSASASHTSELVCCCPSPPLWGSTPDHKATQRSHVLNGSLFLPPDSSMTSAIDPKGRNGAQRVVLRSRQVALCEPMISQRRAKHQRLSQALTCLELSRGHGKGKTDAFSFPCIQNCLCAGENFWETRLEFGMELLNCDDMFLF